MAGTALEFADRYHLKEIANPDGLLPLHEQTARAVTLCESILVDKNWKIYFLHHHNTQQVSFVCKFIIIPVLILFLEIKQVELFANPIFHDYHIDFWYNHTLSPIRRRREGDKMWETTPLRLLASSATAVSTNLVLSSLLF